MRKLTVFLALILVVSSVFTDAIGKEKPKDKVLVFSKTAGYRHESIKEGLVAIQKLGLENNFEVEATEDAGKFITENLKNYKALIFLNPTGTDIFNESQKAALKRYINNGGGFVGLHAAADCSYEWEWYGKMVGAFFKSHPKIQEATLTIISKDHPATRKLPSEWKHTDEWYNFKDLNKDVEVLVKVDEKSYTGGENGDYHPISWYHNFEGGRVFYTALGHTSEDYTSDKLFLSQLLGGIEYAIGRKR
jgi:type 1 glutamine amidotransferase